jgi:hypothetical protein
VSPVVVDWRRTLRQGLIGGLTVTFVVAVGMFQVFDRRKVIDPFFSAGYALILWVPILFGYRAAHPPVPDGVERRAPSRSDVVAGLAAGAMTGLFLGLIVVLIAAKPDIRDTFLHLSPALAEKLSYGSEPWFGLGVLTIGGAILGALGGALAQPAIKRAAGPRMIVPAELVVGDIDRSDRWTG